MSRNKRLTRITGFKYQGLDTQDDGGRFITILDKDADGYIIRATGTAVPIDSTAGYAKGCVFIDTNVSALTNGLYVNVGTTSACNFDLLTANTTSSSSVSTSSSSSSSSSVSTSTSSSSTSSSSSSIS